MGTISELSAALDRVAEAETQLDELAALARLDRLVRTATGSALRAALTTYTATEVAAAVGVSRQAIAKRGRLRKAA
jgi:hypothetical protein